MCSLFGNVRSAMGYPGVGSVCDQGDNSQASSVDAKFTIRSTSFRAI
jgi:hypothetical protein